MAVTRELALEAIYNSVDQLNADFGTSLEKTEGQPLIGGGAGLDSLGFVNFLVALEDSCQRRFGVAVNLSDEVEANADAFATASSLADFLVARLGRLASPV